MTDHELAQRDAAREARRRHRAEAPPLDVRVQKSDRPLPGIRMLDRKQLREYLARGAELLAQHDKLLTAKTIARIEMATVPTSGTTFTTPPPPITPTKPLTPAQQRGVDAIVSGRAKTLKPLSGVRSCPR